MPFLTASMASSKLSTWLVEFGVDVVRLVDYALNVHLLTWHVCPIAKDLFRFLLLFFELFPRHECTSVLSFWHTAPGDVPPPWCCDSPKRRGRALRSHIAGHPKPARSTPGWLMIGCGGRLSAREGRRSIADYKKNEVIRNPLHSSGGHAALSRAAATFLQSIHCKGTARVRNKARSCDRATWYRPVVGWSVQ